MLTVGLLGVFRISNHSVPAWSDLGPAGRTLASYLFAFPDRPHRRERLADLFWPELDQERGRAALNSAVWRVRKVLAACSSGDGGLKTLGSDVLLESCEWLDIDALELQRAANLVIKEPITLKDPAVLERMVHALLRYEGPFLDGDDGDWILEERERLQSLFIQLAIQVICRLAVEHNYASAIDLASFAVKFDPYREELVRYLLGLFVLNEQRAKAVRHFEHWSASLRQELGLAPLPATRALFESICRIQCSDDFDALQHQLFHHDH